MRKEYSLDNMYSLAWGFDHVDGFFLQVFDESDLKEEILVVNADQGIVLSSFSSSNERLTYQKMVETLTQYSQKALNDFEQLMNKRFDDTLIGYTYDENGKYRDKVFIRSNKELFQFIDSIQHKYTIKDGFGLFIDLRTVKEFVTA